MNLDFTDEQQALRDEARRLLAARDPIASTRVALDGGDAYARDLWWETAGMGWFGAAIPEAYGGLGLSRVFLCGLAEEFGRSLAPLPLESSVFTAAEALILAGSEDQKQRWLPQMAQGKAVGALAVSEGLGPLLGAGWKARVRDGRLFGAKAPVCDGHAVEFAVVAAEGEGGPGLWLADLSLPGVTRERLDSFDPSRPLSRLSFDGLAVEPLPLAMADARGVLRRILERGAVYTAFLQLGGAQRALEITVDWAKERKAFGRPIGGFQAVKHRLADLYAKVEIARSNAYFAAWALANEAPELPLAAAVARVSATEAFEQAGRDMIHIHGALGVTWESDCQLFYRRSRHLALVLGAPDEWRERIASELETRNAA